MSFMLRQSATVANRKSALQRNTIPHALRIALGAILKDAADELPGHQMLHRNLIPAFNCHPVAKIRNPRYEAEASTRINSKFWGSFSGFL